MPCFCSDLSPLDESGTPVCDQCKPEYQGPNCEQCRDGFYNADSICLPCNCSGNADPRTSPRTCNPDTGHCLSCINNTTGLHCERCLEGYSGDPLTRTCRAIGERAVGVLDIAANTPGFFFFSRVSTLFQTPLQSVL